MASTSGTFIISLIKEAQRLELLWVDLCPPKRDGQVLTPVPVNVTLFGRYNPVKMRSLWWSLIKYDCCPYKMRKNPCEDRDVQGECHETIEAETGMRQLRAKEN